MSHEDTILITNLSVKGYVARRLLSELSDKHWKLGNINNLLKRIHKTKLLNLAKNSLALNYL